MDLLKELTKNIAWFLAFMAVLFLTVNFLNKFTYMILKVLSLAEAPFFIVF